ncbi:MAG: TSUP family transporter [Mariprofundaceae bacterium]
MDDLLLWQYIATALIFLWTGFVRSGLGFGGAALGLPLLLLVVDNPLIWLPLIGIHLLFFSSITVGLRLTQVDWPFLRKSLSIMIVPKMIGVFGLLTLPTEWLVIFVYVITLFYGGCYLFKYQIKSQHRWVDVILLVFGAYIAGVSLIGAPLIVAVFMHRVAKEQLRNTLFVLWFILVSIKLTVLSAVGVEFWWHAHLWLLPCAAVGHIVGLKLHDRLIHGDATSFKQIIGAALILICFVGLISSIPHSIAAM